MNLKRRVVVTGMGVVSSIGSRMELFSENLRSGVSGLKEPPSFESSKESFPPVYSVDDFDAGQYGVKLLDPFIQFAVGATEQAVEHSGLNLSELDPYSIGISVSSSKGGMYTLDRFKERFIKRPSAIMGARVFTSMVPNFAAQWIARRHKIKGAARCYVAACATGTTAVAQGFRMVHEGGVDYCLAGASDASIVPLMLSGYRNMKALSQGEMKPFDQNRDGFLVGEGAGVLMLETLESAQKRGAEIWGEIKGCRFNQNISHPLLFDLEEHALSINLEGLMRDLNWDKRELDYINLHGTATSHGDLYETQEVLRFLGDARKTVSTSSIKSMTGHMLGASGAVEIIATLIGMKKGFVPPTLNLDQPDEGFHLDYTPKNAKSKKVSKAVKIAMGFGGHVATLALESPKDI